jgi:hypothetical protein
MPPWFADADYGLFSNERRLTAKEIDTLAAWADAGAPAGNVKDAPPAKHFEDGWNIKPDVVVEMPKPFELPPTGTINYKYIVVKTNFKEDMWVVAAEMRPGNAKVLHHGKVWVRPPGSTWLKDAVPGEAYENETQRDVIGRNSAEEGNDILGKFNPGLGPQRFDQEGAAKFVPKGSDLVYEMHYTATGKPESDVSKLGLVLAKADPAKRYYFHAGPTASNLAIPAGDGNAEVVSEVTLAEPGRQDDDGAQGQVRFRMADGLPVRRARAAAARREAAVHHALRQLAGEPLQSGSVEEGRVGPPELGRDEQLLHRRPVRSRGEPGESLRPLRRQHAAPRQLRSDTRRSRARRRQGDRAGVQRLRRYVREAGPGPGRPVDLVIG